MRAGGCTGRGAGPLLQPPRTTRRAQAPPRGRRQHTPRTPPASSGCAAHASHPSPPLSPHPTVCPPPPNSHQVGSEPRPPGRVHEVPVRLAERLVTDVNNARAEGRPLGQPRVGAYHPTLFPHFPHSHLVQQQRRDAAVHQPRVTTHAPPQRPDGIRQPAAGLVGVAHHAGPVRRRVLVAVVQQPLRRDEQRARECACVRVAEQRDVGVVL